MSIYVVRFTNEVKMSSELYSYKKWFEYTAKGSSILAMLLLSVVVYQVNEWKMEVGKWQAKSEIKQDLMFTRISNLEYWRAEIQSTIFTVKDANELQKEFIKAVQDLKYLSETIKTNALKIESNNEEIREIKERYGHEKCK